MGEKNDKMLHAAWRHDASMPALLAPSQWGWHTVSALLAPSQWGWHTVPALIAPNQWGWHSMPALIAPWGWHTMPALLAPNQWGWHTMPALIAPRGWHSMPALLAPSQWGWHTVPALIAPNQWGWHSMPALIAPWGWHTMPALLAPNQWGWHTMPALIAPRGWHSMPALIAPSQWGWHSMPALIAPSQWGWHTMPALIAPSQWGWHTMPALIAPSQWGWHTMPALIAPSQWGWHTMPALIAPSQWGWHTMPALVAPRGWHSMPALLAPSQWGWVTHLDHGAGLLPQATDTVDHFIRSFVLPLHHRHAVRQSFCCHQGTGHGFLCKHTLWLLLISWLFDFQAICTMYLFKHFHMLPHRGRNSSLVAILKQSKAYFVTIDWCKSVFWVRTAHQQELSCSSDSQWFPSLLFCHKPPCWPSAWGICLRSGRSGVRIPLATGCFPGWVIPVTSKLALQWLHCQVPCIIGSVLGLVGLVSVYCYWVRHKVWSATFISVWQHVKLSVQIRPWDTLACFWDVKQATNTQTYVHKTQIFYCFLYSCDKTLGT